MKRPNNLNTEVWIEYAYSLEHQIKELKVSLSLSIDKFGQPTCIHCGDVCDYCLNPNERIEQQIKS